MGSIMFATLQMQSTEEGLLQADELVQTYKHSCSWFIGPFYHLVRVFHPDYVKPLLMAPGRATPLHLWAGCYDRNLLWETCLSCIDFGPCANMKGEELTHSLIPQPATRG